MINLLFSGINLFYIFFQDLPKVPLPSLEETMAEYLRVLEPIVTSQQLEKTKALVKQFAGPNGLGPILQQYLEEKRDTDDNWVNIFKLFNK